jgi:hypothetical protein
VVYYVDSLRSGYYAYGFYQKACEKGTVQCKKKWLKQGKVIFINSHDPKNFTTQAKVNERVDIFYTALIFVSYNKLNSCNLIGLKRTNDNQEATFTVGSPRGRQPMPGGHIFESFPHSFELSAIRNDPPRSNLKCPEAEFLEEVQTKLLIDFLLAIHSHL